MQISEHFEYKEFVHTDYTQFSRENYEQGKQYIDHMRIIANYQLEPLRARYDSPIHLSSAFRCLNLHYYIYKKINEWRVSKGLKEISVPLTSQHLDAWAVDFIIKNIECKKVFDYILIKDDLKFGQLIWEKDRGEEWIHWGSPTLEKNGEVLIFENGKYRSIK